MPEPMALVPHAIHGRKRILVVDDDASIRAVVRRGLEQRLGFICEEAGNGVQGIRKAKEFTPDLIVLDLVMPLMNGFATAMVFHRESPNVPIVVLSMYVHQRFEETLHNKCGVKAIVPKADGITALSDCINRVLTQSNQAS